MDRGDPKLLNEINATTDRWTIVVRVFRRWNICQRESPKDVAATSMLLIDEEGTCIQATALSDALYKFKDTAVEGKVYVFKTFAVTPNLSPYRATSHKFKIGLSSHTKIFDADDDLPKYSYSFVDLPYILKIKEKKDAQQLIDVIAFVKSIGRLEPYRKDDEDKNKLRLIITDDKDNDVECVMWDECAEEVYADYIVNDSVPVVAIFNLARIGFSMDGVAQVHNSYNATRVLFNPDLKEVNEYIANFWDPKGSLARVTEMSQPLPTQFSQPPSAASLLKERRIEISQIGQQKAGDYFVITCEIQKFETVHGWSYEGCAKCAAKVTGEVADFVCPICKKPPQSIEPKLRLHYNVFDSSGSASVAFWDRLAVQLINKTASQLQFIVTEDGDDSEVLDVLDTVVGKRFMIKMRRTPYNIKFPNSSISVSQFIICEDLTDQFDNVVGEGNVRADVAGATTEQSGKKSDRRSSKSPMPFEPANMSESSSSQNVTLLDDEQEDDDDLPLARISRGSKRNGRNENYSQTQSQESVENIVGSAASPSDKPHGKRKMRKSIKQE